MNQQLPPTGTTTTQQLPNITDAPPTVPLFNSPTADPHIVPFAGIYQQNLIDLSVEPIHWVLPDRVPLGALTVIDGDYDGLQGLFAHQLAGCVSLGAPLFEGFPTSRGGTILVTPNVDARLFQFPFFSTYPANLAQIEILSYVRDPEYASHPSGYRPFTLPLDLPRLFEAVDRINAKLIVLDSFIDLLSHDRRWTDQRLAALLADIVQHITSRKIACIITRTCPAKGGQAKPSVLERSERFHRIAMSHLLIARDPLQPDNLLLTQVKTLPGADLAPTLTLRLQKHPTNPNLPSSLTFQGTHSLQAKDFLTHRPEALHRQLLSDHLLQLIIQDPNPIHVSTLYAQSPQSSRSQVQRSLRDLLNVGQIEHPARGFYSPTAANPVFNAQSSVTQEYATHVHNVIEAMLESIMQKVSPEDQDRVRAHIYASIQYDDPTISLEEKLARVMRLDFTLPEDIALQLYGDPAPTPELNEAGATTPEPEATPELNEAGATTSNSEPPPELDSSGATTPDPPQPTHSGLGFVVETPEEARARVLRQESDERLWRQISPHGPLPSPYEDMRRNDAYWRL